MKSADYRAIIKRIARVAIKEQFPGVKLNAATLDHAANLIAVNVHARMYGANVDGVNSPLWRDDKEPNVDALELLKQIVEPKGT